MGQYSVQLECGHKGDPDYSDTDPDYSNTISDYATLEEARDAFDVAVRTPNASFVFLFHHEIKRCVILEFYRSAESVERNPLNYRRSFTTRGESNEEEQNHQS